MAKKREGDRLERWRQAIGVVLRREVEAGDRRRQPANKPVAPRPTGAICEDAVVVGGG